MDIVPPLPRETRTMKTITPALFAGALAAAAMAAALPARADVFSSQGFSGEDTTLNALPGVNLDVSPGAIGAGNCAEVEAPSFMGRRNSLRGATATECRFGNNFTVTTTQSNGMRSFYSNVYSHTNPPPWAESWRP